MANSKKNVSLGKPLVTGAVWWAPVGTTLPTDATTALDAAFKSPGYVGEDGVTFSVDMDTQTVTEMGGTTVLTEISSYSETVQFPLIETNVEALKLRYGTGNVTEDSSTGALTVKHAMPDGESISLVFEIALTGGRVKRIVVPDATLSATGDAQYSAGNAVQYDVTFTANASDSLGGATSVEYITGTTSTTSTTTGGGE